MKKHQLDDNTRRILESMPVPFAVYQYIDSRVVTLAVSDGFCKLFGFKSHEDACWLMDHDMYRGTHPDDKARVAEAAIRFVEEGGEYEAVYRTHVLHREEYRIIHSASRQFTTDTGAAVYVTWYTDEGAYVTGDLGRLPALNAAFSTAMHQESIIQKSHYDFLTGLPGMSYFFELAEIGRSAYLIKGKKPAMLFMDLSGMKFFNRKYGFEEGDKLLRSFADIIKAHFSNENCSRFGSDHFCVYTTADGLDDTLNTIFAEFSEANGGNTLPVRVGIYLDEYGAVSSSTACDRAKYACDTMRNSYVSSFRYFDDSMLMAAEGRQYIIDNFSRALEEKWIQVYYQPIIRSANGRVSDEEALARWIDPIRGMLSPAEFIPILEEAKLIDKLDLYVCDIILEKMKAQKASGLYLVPQSLNLSRIDFDTCDIVEEIRRRVDEADIERSKLTIEITESVLGKDFDFMKEQVERFQRLGFRVWMDDFGSGYSTLDVLQQINFDTVKLDMRFIRAVNKSDKNRVMLTEVIRMAIALGIDTVCEGVETREQANFLREIGCTKMQGFFYCTPIPFEGIVARYEKGIQIGLENPAESDYFAAIGRINLYDLAIITNEDQHSFRNYFNTVPMAIYESNGDEYHLVRCNNTFRTILQNVLGRVPLGERFYFSDSDTGYGSNFSRALHECAMEGTKAMIDEVLKNHTVAHVFLKRIAVNPVTHTNAIAVAVPAITDEQT